MKSALLQNDCTEKAGVKVLDLGIAVDQRGISQGIGEPIERLFSLRRKTAEWL
jgi:hypothetical protein